MPRDAGLGSPGNMLPQLPSPAHARFRRRTIRSTAACGGAEPAREVRLTPPAAAFQRSTFRTFERGSSGSIARAPSRAPGQRCAPPKNARGALPPSDTRPSRTAAPVGRVRARRPSRGGRRAAGTASTAGDAVLSGGVICYEPRGRRSSRSGGARGRARSPRRTRRPSGGGAATARTSDRARASRAADGGHFFRRRDDAGRLVVLRCRRRAARVRPRRGRRGVRDWMIEIG